MHDPMIGGRRRAPLPDPQPASKESKREQVQVLETQGPVESPEHSDAPVHAAEGVLNHALPLLSSTVLPSRVSSHDGHAAQHEREETNPPAEPAEASSTPAQADARVLSYREQFNRAEAEARAEWRKTGICPICKQTRSGVGITGHISKCLRTSIFKVESPPTT